MKLTWKEYQRRNDRKVGEWSLEFDTMENIIKFINKLDAQFSKEHHYFKWTIDEK